MCIFSSSHILPTEKKNQKRVVKCNFITSSHLRLILTLNVNHSQTTGSILDAARILDMTGPINYMEDLRPLTGEKLS